MKLWISILFLFLWLFPRPAYPSQLRTQLDNCLSTFQAIPQEPVPSANFFERVFFRKKRPPIESPVQKLIQQTEGLLQNLRSGTLNEGQVETHQQIDNLINEGMGIAKEQGNHPSIILAMARLHHVAKGKRFKQVEDADSWNERDQKLASQIKLIGLESQWNEALKNILLRSDLTEGYNQQIVGEYKSIDLGASGNGPDGWHYLERARRLMRTHGITPELMVDGKLPLANAELVRVAKILNGAKSKERPRPSAGVISSANGDLILQNHLDSLLSESENKLVDGYKATLAAEQLKNSELKELSTLDDKLHAELKALFDPKNPQRDNPGFNPHMSFVNRFLANPGRYREVVNDIMIHNPPDSVTDTEHDRLFLHVPGLFRMTLEGTFKESEVSPEMEVIAFEYYDYQTGKFGDYHIVEKNLSEGRKKKQWEGDADNKTCAGNCHLSSGSPAGSFAFRGKPIACPVIGFVNAFLK